MTSFQHVTRLLVLQGTPFCNIDCSYCYLADRQSKRRMSMATARQAVHWLYSNGLAADPLHILWHAGEPLVLPPEWYRGAFAEIQAAKPLGAQVQHSIQTNGLLVNDKWCSLFLAHDVGVGVSLDGPAWLHDAHRRSRTGRGTHAGAIRAIRTLQRRDVPFKVLSVVSQATLDAAEPLIDFFARLGVRHLGFNVEEIEGSHRSSSLAAPDARRRFSAFLKRALDRAARYPDLQIRERDALAAWLHDPDFGTAPGNEQNLPFRIVTVTTEGAIHTFSPELAGTAHPTLGGLALGNVYDTSLDDIRHSERFAALWKEVELGIAACANACPYFRLCRGGAPANKLAELGSFAGTETMQCVLAEQATADVVLQILGEGLSAAGMTPSLHTILPRHVSPP